MSDDRDKLLRIMNSLEADYRAGKISREKYSYFRSKYEDKLNSIDAVEASMRIRSMQGKPNPSQYSGKRRRPARDKKRQEQDLVQKYIINPKKDDAKYNKKKKSSMDSGTFKLVVLLVLVIGFTTGIAYGVFNLDFEAVSDTAAVGIVEDTAFPEVSVVLNNTTTFITTNITNTTIEDKNITTDDTNDTGDVETTVDKTKKDKTSSSSSSSKNSKKSSSSGSSSKKSKSGSGSGSGGSSSGGGSSSSGGSSSEGGSEGSSDE